MIRSSEAYREAIVADARQICVKAVVDITDPDLIQGAVTSNGEEPGLSHPEQTYDREFQMGARYFALEKNRTLLDGFTPPAPADLAGVEGQTGLVGDVLSGPDGAFPRPRQVEIQFDKVDILQACSVWFSDRAYDGTAADFTVEVLSEGTAYYRKAFSGNTAQSVSLTGFKVMKPDAIRVTVTRWSLPSRRMRVSEIVAGVYEVWTGDEMSEFSVKHQGDPSCLTTPYGTAYIVMDNQNRRFDPRSKAGVFESIEERQGVELYMGPRLPDGSVEYKPLGVFYQSGDGWKTSSNNMTMKWTLVDIVGLLASRAFSLPEELPETLRGWLEALAGQLGENFAGRVRVDPEYADLPVTVLDREQISGKSCGEILRWVCMAAGTWPRADASTGYLAAEPLWDEGNKITLDNLGRYPTMSANADAASVTVTYYVKETVDHAPAVVGHAYTLPGGSMSSGNTVEVDNPFLHTTAAVSQAVRNILTFYGGNKLELTGRGDPSSEIGDVDTVWLDESSAATARRTTQELSLTNGTLQNCRSILIRGDGLFTFTERAQILESGVFVVPPGVYRLRLILTGRGQDGKSGGTGVRGRDGSGGKVWSGVVTVNPGQEISVEVGQDTVFWHYSSADGQVYPEGFTDISSGECFGRSGVKEPKAGSGDGGEGGAAGRSGYVYCRVDTSDPEVWYIHRIEYEPVPGKPGSPGASGSAVIYWEKPEGQT